jgi:hypothetical protein
MDVLVQVIDNRLPTLDKSISQVEKLLLDFGAGSKSFYDLEGKTISFHSRPGGFLFRIENTSDYYALFVGPNEKQHLVTGKTPMLVGVNKLSLSSIDFRKVKFIEIRGDLASTTGTNVISVKPKPLDGSQLKRAKLIRRDITLDKIYQVIVPLSKNGIVVDDLVLAEMVNFNQPPIEFNTDFVYASTSGAPLNHFIDKFAKKTPTSHRKLLASSVYTNTQINFAIFLLFGDLYLFHNKKIHLVYSDFGMHKDVIPVYEGDSNEMKVKLIGNPMMQRSVYIDNRLVPCTTTGQLCTPSRMVKFDGQLYANFDVVKADSPTTIKTVETAIPGNITELREYAPAVETPSVFFVGNCRVFKTSTKTNVLFKTDDIIVFNKSEDILVFSKDDITTVYEFNEQDIYISYFDTSTGKLTAKRLRFPRTSSGFSSKFTGKDGKTKRTRFIIDWSARKINGAIDFLHPITAIKAEIT